MTAKMVEILDRMTFIPAIAIRLDPANIAECYLLDRAGYGMNSEMQRQYILLFRASGDGAIYGSGLDWTGHERSRTFKAAHRYLLEHFDDVAEGGVIDIEFVLGETERPKESERREAAL